MSHHSDLDHGELDMSGKGTAMLHWGLIEEARTRIAPWIHRTPVLTSQTFDARADAKLFFKCENLQKTGSFKARGASNAVFSLSKEEAARGVATHSSGNHAAAVARAAKLRGISAYIVMPNNAPAAKQLSVRRYGGEIIICEPTQQDRERTVQQVMHDTGAILVHAYDDLRVMAGQATTAVELIEQVENLDLILCPVGGGGHLSGIAAAAKHLRPNIRVIGIEPAGADDAARSFRAGKIIACAHPETVADGLRTTVGAKPFVEIQRWVDDVATVSETCIIDAMRSIWEVMKVIVEPSGAVAFAAIADGKLEVRGKRVGIVLTGGNLDLDLLPWISNAENMPGKK
jgi:threonine dehydratase